MLLCSGLTSGSVIIHGRIEEPKTVLGIQTQIDGLQSESLTHCTISLARWSTFSSSIACEGEGKELPALNFEFFESLSQGKMRRH